MPPSKRDELVDAAMNVFVRNGFHASGLEAILQASGISKMTIYNHFASKDELILAALRRRDEMVRNGMMKFVEGNAKTAEAKLLAVFDFLERWFGQQDFCGCTFINASAEYGDPQSPPRQVAAEHKRAVLRYVRGLCEQLAVADPEELANRLDLVFQGAIVAARVRLQAAKGADVTEPARLAKRVARLLIDEARRAGPARGASATNASDDGLGHRRSS
jgi:AcrR family transcriptional regulator